MSGEKEVSGGRKSHVSVSSVKLKIFASYVPWGGRRRKGRRSPSLTWFFLGLVGYGKRDPRKAEERCKKVVQGVSRKPTHRVPNKTVRGRVFPG
ncbi:hypothetical protein LptCag_1864 [Leptospirillum ferriphilum]|jgi:hypothetical protein|uniref:Uncharacterized protein n=1 Tax=Leptospirillum ferriphilum TaxID=178606 RepID=A0A094X3L4_9BACT|nr:hypothetical protein ABH19_08755 [Leptospirillum sp. Group II 'CF-1']KGA93169.1 hypothetical protein LptCag_1864 [Leptospirillum ferriphilum]